MSNVCRMWQKKRLSLSAITCSAMNVFCSYKAPTVSIVSVQTVAKRSCPLLQPPTLETFCPNNWSIARRLRNYVVDGQVQTLSFSLSLYLSLCVYSLCDCARMWRVLRFVILSKMKIGKLQNCKICRCCNCREILNVAHAPRQVLFSCIAIR